MSDFTEHLQIYHTNLKSIVRKGDFNEHTFRTPLENLLNALKPKDIKLIHEPKARQGQGSIRPDFKVYKQTPNYEALQGFIECKNYKENLDTLIKGKQIEKYLSVCPNLILTDYNRFILLSFGKVVVDLTLFPLGLENELLREDKAINIEIEGKFTQLLQNFFEISANIKSKDELVQILSTQSFYLSETIFKSDELGFLHSEFNRSFEKAFTTFASLENTTFSKIEFCDILAQSVVYGIFVAYIENDEFEIDKIPIQSFIQLLPQHFLTLQEFVYYSLPFFALPESIKYALENIKKTIALIDKASLATSFKTEIQSLSIYLYEDFLKAYDTLRGEQRRKEGGVFYTPQAVVNMIVSSLNELLQSKFHKNKGFGDESVKVLDFATGTGSFLARVFELILANESEVFAKEMIINKCLKDIYGFELSFVPYIVAHLKLSSILRQKGFANLNSTQNFQIFLTNTLDLDNNKEIQMQVPFDSLKGQREEALKLKHKEDLLVILGNPPYNVKSKNKGKEILALLQSYKQGLNETKINLDDDYIKFIRFAQWKLLEQKQKQGLMGFITNNSYLFGRTHRKMREHLARAFDEIYILNLHGDSDIDGKEDKNVFDIRQGVCISLFVKYTHSHNKTNLAKIFYYSTKDNSVLTRNDKFALLNDIAQNGLNSIKWQELKLSEPYFWFVPKNFENDEYENFWALASNKSLGENKVIFENYGSGNKAERDTICIHFEKETLKSIIDNFSNKNLDIETIRTQYALPKDARDWSIERARADILANVDCHDFADAKSRNDKAPVIASKTKQSIENKITQIAYRPFDIRYTFFTGKSRGFWGTPSMLAKHFQIGKNLGLCFTKDCEENNYDNTIITDKLIDKHYNGGHAYIAPLYLYQDSSEEVGKISKIPNFTREFSDFKAQSKVLKDKSPEQILAFIYANLFSPHYRTKYLEYLKIGFPRVNFEVSESEFNAYEKLGQRLIDLHLFNAISKDTSIMLKFSDKADKQNPNFTLEKPRFVDDKIVLNKDLEIVGVTKDIYEFSIGGYKVLDKWLKYRVGRALSKTELEHLVNVACIIKESIKIQTELENLASFKEKQ